MTHARNVAASIAAFVMVLTGWSDGETSPAGRVIQQQTPLVGRLFSGKSLYTAFDATTLAVTPDPTHNAPLSSFTFRSQLLAVSVPGGSSPGAGSSATVEMLYVPGHSFPVSFTMPDGEANGTGLVTADEQFFRYSGSLVNGNPMSDCGSASHPGGCNFILVGGTPTPSSGIPIGGFATYQMTPFFSPIPFSDKAMFGSFAADSHADGTFTLASGVTVSPMYVARSPVLASPAPNNQRATHLQASLGIVGLGKDQHSFLVGESGEFFTEQGSTVALGGEVVGSLRAGGQAPILRLGSGVGSVSVPEGNAIFGPNANYLVLGPDGIAPPSGGGNLIRTNQTGFQIPFDTLTEPRRDAKPGNWSLDGIDYYHATAATQDSVLPRPGGMPLGTQRTSQTLSGYTAGVLDRRTVSSTTGAVAITPTVFTSGSYNSASNRPPGLSVETDAATNRLTAALDISTTTLTSHLYNLTDYSILLGNRTGADSGRGAFVDDFIFAARDSSAPSTMTTTLTDVSGSPSDTTTVSSRFIRILMIPSKAVPLAPEIFPEVTLCDPTSLRWGWWIGEILYSGPSAFIGPVLDRLPVRDRFHLATWVAGVMPNAAQMPSAGTATYTGHVVGNVVDAASNRYIAAGNFSLTWNFRTKSGTVDILGFDEGGSLGASGVTFRRIPVNASGYGDGNCFSNCDEREFSGFTQAGSIAGLTANLHGGLFRSPMDPTTAVGGVFQITQRPSPFSGYRAAVTFVGERSVRSVPRDRDHAPAERTPRPGRGRVPVR